MLYICNIHKIGCSIKKDCKIVNDSCRRDTFTEICVWNFVKFTEPSPDYFFKSLLYL